MRTINQLLTEYFRCPELATDFVDCSEGSSTGYFRLGKDLVCYGRSTAAPVARTLDEPLYDATADTRFEPGRCVLSFDAVECLENLCRERYVADTKSLWDGKLSGMSREFYYFVRPLLPISIRRHIQRWVLAPRLEVQFPHWPLDRSADRLLESLLAVAMLAQNAEEIPFIWFWPDGASSAAIVTHDVETQSGVRFCPALMDLDEEFRIPASFQIVPEDRYDTSPSLLQQLRQRGFEINVHDLNHDGRLYWDEQEFMRRAKRINFYGKEFQARGFRSGALYRNLDWYSALEFSYDMSVPNVAHLEPQAGGCCTVMPFFVGQILELPVTTVQDYALFHILGQYSIDLWREQMRIIQQGHGLISVITHPDYLQEHRARRVYAELLTHLNGLRSDMGLWITLPSEVNDWWRLRSRLQLVRDSGKWRIEGQGSERARIAHARLNAGRLQFELRNGEDRIDSPAESPVFHMPSQPAKGSVSPALLQRSWR